MSDLPTRGVGMTEQIEGAEVALTTEDRDALIAAMTARHVSRADQADRLEPVVLRLIAAAEVRGAQAVLAAVEGVAEQWDPSPLSVAAEIVAAARAAAAAGGGGACCDHPKCPGGSLCCCQEAGR